MTAADDPGGDAEFLREINRALEVEARRLNATWESLDLYFLVYLRKMSRFGYFTYGPISIDVRLIEDLVERTVEKGGPGAAWSDDMVRFSARLMDEVRRSGRRRIDELHFLLAFMRSKEGLPHRVFSELGVSPEEVEAYSRRMPRDEGGLAKLYSPEEAAKYLGVTVQTVRAWIRSGRLKARRLAGQRALRIRESDLEAVLEPVHPEEAESETE
jgi:excisionase family DNA binding protein